MAGKTRQRFVKTAKEYLGCKEANGGHKPIIDLYNSIQPLPRGYKMSYTDPWCAAFPSAIAAKSGMLDIVFPECSCEAMINLYKAKGRWREADDYIAHIGDIIMYDWGDDGRGNCTGTADHTGIIAETSGGKMLVLEGNMSDSVGYRTLAINAKYIRGFCCPEFEDDNKVSDSDTDTGPAIIQEAFVPMPIRVLKFGMIGPDVGSMQRLLIGRGYNCGRYRDDEDFGVDTQASLESFQQDNGLYPSGIFDADTFSALWG